MNLEDLVMIAAMIVLLILTMAGKTKWNKKMIGFLFFFTLGSIIIIVAPQWGIISVICIFLAFISAK